MNNTTAGVRVPARAQQTRRNRNNHRECASRKRLDLLHVFGVTQSRRTAPCFRALVVSKAPGHANHSSS